MSEMRQMTIFDFPEVLPGRRTYTPTAEHKPGDYLEDFGETPGMVICHIMRPGYIGELVCYDCSTQSHRWTQVGVLEKYFYHEGNKCWRSVIYTGKQQRTLFDHFPGREIHEVGHREWENGKWEFH